MAIGDDPQRLRNAISATAIRDILPELGGS
jgi:hypothetical protein